MEVTMEKHMQAYIFGRWSNLVIVSILAASMLWRGLPANAASEVLLKSTADLKYHILQRCINDNGNDISACIGNVPPYIKAEKEVIRTAPDQSESTGRLTKFLDFLQKSTDIFFSKAKETNDPTYYEKAYRCADLLINLSDKYKDYQNVIIEYKHRQHGADATGALNALYDKIQGPYPYPKFQTGFNTFSTVCPQNGHKLR